MHNLYEQRVTLRESDHRYHHENGEEYLSFSRLYDFLVEPFDKENISRFVAKAKGVSQEDVLNDWNSRTENGSRIDKALEIYAKDKLIFDTDLDVQELIRSVADEYKDYHSTHEQLVLFNEEFRIAGMTDKLFIFGNRKDSNFGISDFKCYEKPEDLYKVRGWAKEPFKHLHNSKFTKICFQLSTYAFMFESLTGRRCKELFIHVIDSVNKTHKKVYVPYLRNDVLALLNHNKENILNKLNPELTF